MPLDAVTRRRLPAGSVLLPTYALAFVATAADLAFVPLLPDLRDALGLSGAAAGVLVAATMAAMLVLALPLGLLTDRVGARPLLAAGGVLAVLACVALAMADSFGALLAARLALGMSVAIVWTAAPVRLAEAANPTQATGRLLAAGGLGLLVAPAFGGVVAGLAGPQAPFVALAVLALPVSALLLTDRARARPVEEPASVRDAAAVVRRERPVRVAVVTIALLGVTTGATSLAAPLHLHHNGLSSGAIGAVLSATAVVWIATAAAAGRLRDHRLRPSLVGGAALVLAGSWLLPALAPATVAIVVFLLVSAACRASLNTLLYRLARPRGGAAFGGVLGLMNVVYAGAGMVAPVAAGALVAAGAGQLVFGAVGMLALAVGVWVRRGEGAPARAPVGAAAA